MSAHRRYSVATRAAQMAEWRKAIDDLEHFTARGFRPPARVLARIHEHIEDEWARGPIDWTVDRTDETPYVQSRHGHENREQRVDLRSLRRHDRQG